MTCIIKIASLRHPGVLRDFTWPSDLPSFARYNLIYGWNGTGKTTLSNLFRALELRKLPEGEATLVLESAAVTSSDFPQATLPIRVFNRDFVSENVFPAGGGEVPLIFVLGQESAEKQAQVERLKGDKTKVEGVIESARQEKIVAEKTLDKHCVDQATVIRETLRSSGNNFYNNYDKTRYRQRVVEMLDACDKVNYLLSDGDRERLLSQKSATPKLPIDEVRLILPDLHSHTHVTDQLIRKTVVSSALKTLKDDAQLSSWARDGLGLHHERKTDYCLFCEQPLPGQRLAALEAHFNTEYEQLMREVDTQIAELESSQRSISEVSLPNRAEFYEDLALDFDQFKTSLDNEIASIVEHLVSLVDVLTRKKLKLFEKLSLEITVPEIQHSLVENINTIIKRHNQTSTDFDRVVHSARVGLEADSVARSLDEFQNLVETLRSQEAAVTNAQTQAQQIDMHITKLEAEIIQHRQPAEELNRDLHSYLGHTELQLDVKETGYTITRNGTLARSLSEGETTAIALLYFLKTLKDRRFEKSKGLVVLDDPVTSLDANALFLAFSFIRNCVDGAGQIIILTHNFAMFRQVRNWFHYLKGQNKNNITKHPARFYMLNCSLTDQGRRSRISPLDPLLEQFESEYHYLFASVYRRAKENSDIRLESNYIFPNIARRLLEAFLAFRRPQSAGELHQKLQEIDFDQTKKLRILRFLHAYSHADAIIDPEHDPSVLCEAQAVLRDLLELIQKEDGAHYNAMAVLVDSMNFSESYF